MVQINEDWRVKRIRRTPSKMRNTAQEILKDWRLCKKESVV